MDILVVGLIIAVALERFVEIVVKPFLTPDPEYVPAIAVILGVILAVSVNFDAFGMSGHALPLPYVGALITGVFIGGGASGWNDLQSLIGGRSPFLLAAPAAEEPKPAEVAPAAPAAPAPAK